MDETRQKLLDRGVMVLDAVIDHETYEAVLEGLFMRPEQDVVLYCAGEGGMARMALAIADLVQQHGMVIGMLPGPAMSCHATIWAACGTRYVFPHGRIGVHNVCWTTQRTLDAQSLDVLAKEFEGLNQETARILAAAAKADVAHWRAAMQAAGSHGFTVCTAADLIAMDMAEPVSKFVQPGTQIGQDRGLFVESNGRVEKGDAYDHAHQPGV